MSYIDALTICTTILGLFWSLREVFKKSMFRFGVLTFVSCGLIGMYVFYSLYVGFSIFSENICNIYIPTIKFMRLIFTIIAIPWSSLMFYHFKRITKGIID